MNISGGYLKVAKVVYVCVWGEEVRKVKIGLGDELEDILNKDIVRLVLPVYIMGETTTTTTTTISLVNFEVKEL